MYNSQYYCWTETGDFLFAKICRLSIHATIDGDKLKQSTIYRFDRRGGKKMVTPPNNDEGNDEGFDKKDKAVPDVKQKQNVQRTSDEASKRRVVKVAPGMLQESLSPATIGDDNGPGGGDKDSNVWKNTDTTSLAASAPVTAASVRSNRARAKASSERDKKAKWGSREADRISRKERLRPVSSKDSSARSESDIKAKRGSREAGRTSTKERLRSHKREVEEKLKATSNTGLSKVRGKRGRQDEDADAREKAKWKNDDYVMGMSDASKDSTIQPGAIRVTAAKDSESSNHEDSQVFDLAEEEYATKYKPKDVEAVSAAVIDEDALQEEFESKMKAQMVQAAEVDPYDEPGFCQKHACQIGCFCFLVIISLVFGLLFGLREVEVTNSPTMSPTLRPDDEFLEDLYSQISDGDLLMDESTPQGQALSLMKEEAETAYNVRDKSDTELIERYAMRVFYFSTNGNFWTISEDDSTENNFTSTSNIPVCDWLPEKITCNERNEVSRMEMVNTNMNGTIPNEFGELTALSYLNFGFNKLQGQFPDTLNKLTEMSYMRFVLNSMSGTIPSAIGDFTKLTYLNLMANRFTGTIPNNFWRSIHERIFLAYNGLNGTIPALLPQMALDIFDAQQNDLSGTLPKNLAAQPNLVTLSLSGNRLTGTIPEQLRALANLENLLLQNNMFNSTIPDALGRCKNLQWLYLNNNEFTGTLPSFYSKLDEVRQIKLQNNNFNGNLPEEWGSGMDELIELDVSNNANLQGRVPANLLSKDLNLLDITGTEITEGLGCESPISAFVTADCGGTNPFVACSCCTTCCDGDNCEVDLESICESRSTRWEEYGEENNRDNFCQCSPDSSQITCNENCQSCSVDMASCVENTNYGNDLDPASGDRLNFFNTIEYVTGIHTGTTITFTETLSEDRDRVDYCEVAVNGTACRQCLRQNCLDGSQRSGLVVTCDNLETPAEVNTCDNVDPTNYLEAFSFWDLARVSGCELLLYRVAAESNEVVESS